MSTVATAFDEYWVAIATGDGPGAVRTALREFEDGVPLEDLLDGLVGAAQAEVGRLWAADEWNIAQEHRATSIGEDVVCALAARIDATPNGRTGVITCTDGEWHSLPSRILNATLRAAGWQVTFLGASVPARNLSQLLHELGPDATLVSCALPTRLPEARQMIEVSRDAGIPVLVGGRGFGPDGRWGPVLGADAWAPDARGALAALAELPAFTSPAPPLAQPDEAIAELRRRARDIVDESMQRMLAAMPDVARYDPRQLQRTQEDVGYILDFLCAALYVDDATLFTDFVDWLTEILVARTVPAGTVRAGLRVVSEVIATEPGPYDRAQAFLQAGIDRVR
jgi:methanogenic corrinoid protein MtbC1